MNPKKGIIFIVAPTLIIGFIIMMAYSTDPSAGKPFGIFNDFLIYLLGNISRIPFTISLGSAMALTFMYVGSFFTSPMVKSLIIPMWTFAIITYFFPNLIPPQLNFLALMIFGLMVTGMFTVLNYKGKLTVTKRRREIAHSIALRIKEMDKSLKIMDFALEEVITEILKKHKLP